MRTSVLESRLDPLLGTIYGPDLEKVIKEKDDDT